MKVGDKTLLITEWMCIGACSNAAAAVCGRYRSFFFLPLMLAYHSKHTMPGPSAYISCTTRHSLLIKSKSWQLLNLGKCFSKKTVLYSTCYLSLSWALLTSKSCWWRSTSSFEALHILNPNNCFKITLTEGAAVLPTQSGPPCKVRCLAEKNINKVPHQVASLSFSETFILPCCLKHVSVIFKSCREKAIFGWNDSFKSLAWNTKKSRLVRHIYLFWPKATVPFN